jgi:glycosyltransferase involved in cell wall biosynthesis
MRIIHTIARLNVGGAALSVLELAASQRRRGHDVLVVAGRVPAGEASMEHVADELAVPYLHLSTLQREVSAASDVATIRALRSLIRERRPDVLHTHTSKAGATGRTAATLAGRARPAAVVHTYHGHVLSGYFQPARERVYRVVERALAHATDRLIAVSDEVRDDLVRLGVAPVEKFVVVPYGFDLDARVHSDQATRIQKRQEAAVTPDAFVIGWAGRLTDIKRPLDLVRAAAAVERSVLVLAGDGELRPDVEALAQELDMSNRVRLLGYVADMGSWYAAFDAFLLTSANEGAPVVAIEAQAAAVPVVATNAGGTRTVVDDGETGFLVGVGDIDALADRLTRLRDDSSLRARLGATAAQRMRSKFSIERMVDDIEGVYAEILAK